MSSLKNKLQFEGSDVEFTKSIFRLQILSDLLSKELNANYPRLNINYRKELKGIERCGQLKCLKRNGNVFVLFRAYFIKRFIEVFLEVNGNTFYDGDCFAPIISWDILVVCDDIYCV